MRAERAGDLRELRIVHPDLGRAGQAAARRDQGVVALLLFGSHFVVGDFGIAAERRSLGHRSSSSLSLLAPAQGGSRPWRRLVASASDRVRNPKNALTSSGRVDPRQIAAEKTVMTWMSGGSAPT